MEEMGCQRVLKTAEAHRSMKIEPQEVPKSNFKEYNIDIYASMGIKLQEVPKSYPTNTDFSDTYPYHIIISYPRK